LEGNNLQKLRTSIKTYPKELSHLPLENEKKLHELIIKHIGDNEVMALILIKCFGCSLNHALSLRWRDIEEYDDQIIIRGKKDNTGSFHTFDRPVLLEGTFLIKARREYLLKKMGEDAYDLGKKRVIPIRHSNHSETELKGRLTKYIRKMLIEAGLKPSEISAVAPNSRTPGGSGVALLNKHYQYVLSERCGLELDSPEGKFMRGLVPGDTTNIYYRSLTDRLSGTSFLLTITRRDDFFFAKDFDMPEITVDRKGSKAEYQLPSPGPGRKLSIIIPKTFLQSGTKITIKSKYGVSGNILFKDYLSSDEIIEKRIY